MSDVARLPRPRSSQSEKKRSDMNGLSTSLPLYVTRKTASGATAHYSAPFWVPALAFLIVWLNVIVWGCIGLGEAVRVVF